MMKLIREILASFFTPYRRPHDTADCPLCSAGMVNECDEYQQETKE
jgi:hypothetical protein